MATQHFNFWIKRGMLFTAMLLTFCNSSFAQKEISPFLALKENSTSLKKCELRYFALTAHIASIAQYESIENNSLVRSKSGKEKVSEYWKEIFETKMDSAATQDNMSFPKVLPETLKKTLFSGNVDENASTLLAMMALTKKIIDSTSGVRACTKEELIKENVIEWKKFIDFMFDVNKLTEYYTIYDDGDSDGRYVFTNDNRIDIPSIDALLLTYFEKNSLKNANHYGSIFKNWRSSFILIDKSFIIRDMGKNVRISAHKLSEAGSEEEPYCAGIEYDDQLVLPSIGSGILLNKKKALLAGHLLVDGGKELDFESLILIQCYNIGHIKGNTVVVPKSSIFKIKTNTKPQIELKSGDWALMEVESAYAGYPNNDRFVKDKNLKVPSQGSLSIYSIGYGLGLPSKLVYNGKMWKSQNPEDPDAYYARLDMFNGNSGSPIFDASTDEIVGILTHGAADFFYNEEKKCFEPQIIGIGAFERVQLLPTVVTTSSAGKPASARNITLLQEPETNNYIVDENREPYKNNAPYIHLERVGNGNNYNIGVLIPVGETGGKRLVGPDSNGNVIKFTLVADAQNTSPYLTTIMALTDKFSTDTITIRVIDATNNNATLTSKLVYKHADATLSNKEGGYMLDAPYTYLKLERDNVAATPDSIKPYLLIPTKLAMAVEDTVVGIDSSGFKSVITLSGSAGTSINVLRPEKTNKSIYWAIKPSNPRPYWTVTVTDPTKKIKKNKHLNNSADPKPRRKYKKRRK
jgi:hypothetical protein